jgi:aconitate hydratase
MSNSFNARRDLTVGEKTYAYYSLQAAEEAGLEGVARLPVSMKVLLENLLRNEGQSVQADDIRAVAAWLENKGAIEHEIAFKPARVLMQDFTGVPAVVDLAAMRDAMVSLGADAAKINPLNPVDLVIDHSVMVDYSAAPTPRSERRARVRAQPGALPLPALGLVAFNNFRVVPPGHRYLPPGEPGVPGPDRSGRPRRTGSTSPIPTRWSAPTATPPWSTASPCWAGASAGIEAEAAMLGQPIPMLIPEGDRLPPHRRAARGRDRPPTWCSPVVQMLRKIGVVGKFVEFFGDGLLNLTIEDQATIANMAPEYGATCGFFPVSQPTLDYLAATGRTPERVALVEAYAKAQGMWGGAGCARARVHRHAGAGPRHSAHLARRAQAPAGPRGPDRSGGGIPVALARDFGRGETIKERVAVEGADYTVGDGDVVIAAITSCTNTSNPAC